MEEIYREEMKTKVTVVEKMTVAAVRQNEEDAVVVSDGMMTKTTDEAAGVSNDEQTLLEQLLQGNGMGENCEEQKHVEEKYERDGMQKEMMQSKAKAVADCGVQTQEGEMVEAWKEGSIMSHERSALEVGRPNLAMLKRVEESGGVDEGFIQVTKRDMDTLFEKAKLEAAMTANSTMLMTKVLKDMNGKNVGVNPEEVVRDDVMDCEWKRGDKLPVDEQVRNLREEMAEMSLRVERLERNMCLGCEESVRAVREEVNGLGGVALWWVKTKTKMNSASRRKVHRAISQSLGKSSEENKLCEEKNVRH